MDVKLSWEGVWEQGTEEKILTQIRQNSRKLEMKAQWMILLFVLQAKYYNPVKE
jgi:hypothetical protein